jgi:hypothetical protein
MTAPILICFNSKYQSIVETDVSNFTPGAVPSHNKDHDIVHTIAYYSRNFSLGENQYKIDN